MNLTDAAAFIEGLPNHNSSRDVGVAFANWISPGGYLAVSCGEFSRDAHRPHLGVLLQYLAD